MKKITALALASVMTLSLFACGKNDEDLVDETVEEQLEDEANLTLDGEIEDLELEDLEEEEYEVEPLLDEEAPQLEEKPPLEEKPQEIPPALEAPKDEEKPVVPPAVEAPKDEEKPLAPPSDEDKPAAPPEGEEHAPAVPPEGDFYAPAAPPEDDVYAPAVPPEGDDMGMPEIGGYPEGMGQGGPASTSLYNSIYNSISGEKMLDLLDEEFLVDFYGIDPSLYDSFAFAKAMMMTSIDEVCIIEASAGNVSAVESILRARAESVKNGWNYPSNLEAAANYVVITKGNFVMYAVGTHVDDFATKF